MPVVKLTMKEIQGWLDNPLRAKDVFLYDAQLQGLGARLLDADESARKGSGGGEMGG
jgi:hypothetical protein